MSVFPRQSVSAPQAPINQTLHELDIAIHRLGYKHLCVAISRYAQDDTQSLSKTLYPYIAKRFGYTDWHAVEHSIRVVIHDAWEDRDPEVWSRYFPNQKKPPSNKQFIATLAEYLK